MSKIFFLLVFIVSLIVPTHAEELNPESRLTPWADIWGNGAYYTTNGEDKNFRGVLLRSEGRFGIQLGTGTTALPYIVYYGVSGQDPNYWNNNLAYGVGVRAVPFSSAETKSWAFEWVRDIKIYGEILSLSFLKGDEIAKANKVKTDDFRYGIDIWHEWNLNNIDRKYFWAEMWGRIDYRNTNFVDPTNKYADGTSMDKFQTYVGSMQLKIGRHLMGGVRPYIAGYYTTSGSKAVWLNSLYYGLGLRMEPFRDQEDAPVLLRKFKMFVEALKITWLGDKDPSRPTSDFKFGVEFTYGR